jgi:uncharacterized delta-60 repeat protein
MRLMRLSSDGTLDRTFGIEGIATTNFGTQTSFSTEMVTQSDDKIIVVGVVNRSNGISDFVVVRYTENGVLDTTFNGIGKNIINFNLGTDVSSLSSNVALQTDGKILVTGQINKNVVLIRLSTNGILDTSFNNTGIIVRNNNSGGNESGSRVVIREDKKIILMTRSVQQVPFYEVKNALVQYNPNGSLDTLFGIKGILPLKPENVNFRILNDNKIIVATDSSNKNTTDSIYFTLSRYKSNGLVDSTFGIEGSVKQKLLYAGFRFTLLDIFEQNDERILIGGSVQVLRSSVSTLFRYSKNGVIDTTFGIKGQKFTSGGSYWYYEQYRGMSQQRDGKILLCSTYNGYSRYLRFNNSFIVGIEKPIENKGPLSIFPNPTQNELNIDLKDQIHSDFSLKISDLTGRIVYQNKYDKTLINNILKLNIGDLISGLYVVTIQSEKEIMSQLISKK